LQDPINPIRKVIEAFKEAFYESNLPYLLNAQKELSES